MGLADDDGDDDAADDGLGEEFSEAADAPPMPRPMTRQELTTSAIVRATGFPVRVFFWVEAVAVDGVTIIQLLQSSGHSWLENCATQTNHGVTLTLSAY